MDNKIEEALTSIAQNTHHPLSEVKEMYRMVEDVEHLSRIIKVAASIKLSPFDLIKALKEMESLTGTTS